MDWIILARDSDRWRALVYLVMKFLGSVRFGGIS